jgi:hypothetical protein
LTLRLAAHLESKLRSTPQIRAVQTSEAK